MASKTESMEPIEPGAQAGKNPGTPQAPVHASPRAAANGAAPDSAVLPVDEIVPAVPTQPAIFPSIEDELPAPSPFLRIWRFLGGVGALLVAWAAIVAIYLLVINAEATLAHFELIPIKVAVAVGGALVLLWLAVAFLSCAVAGAYCLLLAVTHRRW